MIDYTHDPLFVAASLMVALMAGFSGLSLTRGASQLSEARRQIVVALSAIVLGWGIWSMHFVAMLGLELPVLYYYDALRTLISALLAILIVGLALVLVHFGTRTRGRIVLAGAVLGLGIPVMHYVGMSGMEICRPINSVSGVVIALAASVVLGIGSFLISYGQRHKRNILLGTAGFGLAVFAVHFTAMAGTGFEIIDTTPTSGPIIGNHALAFGVTLSVFVLSGLFLLTGATFASAPVPPKNSEPSEPDIEEAPRPTPEPASSRLPYEAEAKTHFINADDVSAIRAEGHYTVLYAGRNKLFCPWSIAEAEARVDDIRFARTHRSYLVNVDHVTSFERKKDTGICYFDSGLAIEKVPVSRSRLAEIRERLGM
ncbi:MAG: MHYT domain-containing protein [Pseudomonadota bacterium]